MNSTPQEPNPPRICPDCEHEYAPDLAVGLGDGCPKCLASFMQETPAAPTPPGDGLKPGDVIGGAEIIEWLGHGGMGTVYKARQAKLGRTVAVKVLDPKLAESEEFTARFLREAKALAALNHTNIVQIHDYGEENGRYFLIMEYVDGASLRQLLNTGEVTPEAAIRYVPQMCDALEYAHGKGVIHRDIKPENILIDRFGNLKIADFGIAKMQGDGGEDAGWMTAANQVMGTANYMAPEQRKHLPSLDHRADIFSMGVVFYEMLTGELPIGRFPSPSQRVKVEVSLDEVVLKALEQDPGRRYQRASEVKQALTAPPAAAPPVPSASGFSIMAIGAACLMLPGFFGLWNIIEPYNDHMMMEPGKPILAEVWQYVLMPMTLVLALAGTVMGWVSLARIRKSESLRGAWLAAICAILYPAAGVLCFLYSLTEYVFHGYGRAAMWPFFILNVLAILPGIPILIVLVRRYLRSDSRRVSVRVAVIAVAVMILSLTASTLNSLEKRQAAYAGARLFETFSGRPDTSPMLPELPQSETNRYEFASTSLNGWSGSEGKIFLWREKEASEITPGLLRDIELLYNNHYGDMYLDNLTRKSNHTLAFLPGNPGDPDSRFVAWIMPDRKGIGFIGKRCDWARPLADFVHDPSGALFLKSLEIREEENSEPKLVLTYTFPVGLDAKDSPERRLAYEKVKTLTGVEPDRIYEYTLTCNNPEPLDADFTRGLFDYNRESKPWLKGVDVGPRFWGK